MCCNYSISEMEAYIDMYSEERDAAAQPYNPPLYNPTILFPPHLQPLPSPAIPLPAPIPVPTPIPYDGDGTITITTNGPHHQPPPPPPPPQDPRLRPHIPPTQDAQEHWFRMSGLVPNSAQMMYPDETPAYIRATEVVRG